MGGLPWLFAPPVVQLDETCSPPFLSWLKASYKRRQVVRTMPALDGPLHANEQVSGWVI
jgi:hypothetical protein